MRQRGFTLVEMMVVVAIIAVLTTVALVKINPVASPKDVSQRLSDMVREANREAINYGTIRTNVMAANASLTKARACVVGSTNNGITTFTMNLLQETALASATTYAWTAEQSYSVPSTVTSYAYATSVGPYASVTPLTTWSSFNLCCYPDGTCDPYSVFFQNTRGGHGGLNYQARLSVLPIGAMPVIRADFTSQ